MIHSIDDIISCLTGRKSVFVKKVASVVGQIISTYLVIGNLVYLMTKHLTIDVNTSASWYSYIKLSESSIEQLQFWKLYISEVNVKHFSVDESCHSIIYSDASDTGFGGYIVEAPQNIAHGMWVESERSNSSTWKELSAAYESEINFLPPALHTNVDVLMDLLCESKADSTVKTYHAGFIRWKKWAVHNGISRCDILPAKSLHVALYLSSLVQNSHTASPVISAFYSIQWAHHMIGQTSPTENLVVKNVLEGMENDQYYSSISAEKTLHLQNTTLKNNRSLNNNRKESIKATKYQNNENKTTKCLEETYFGLKKNGLKISHLNIRGVLSKFDEMKLFINQKNNTHIMGICETFLTSNTEDSFISIKGFELERKDRCETNKIPAGVRFTIPFIKLDETKKLLSKLETSKASGLDEVGPFIFKFSTEGLALSITYLISILEGVSQKILN
ncbi:unnamed protein product [Mytilus edulis]|uniref:Uncharacterized protein n=1 Tax=Mytilus edulis TaxID=6550 RepID=A0A8S3SL98_MYTED|nr:unnamed protein product [Mytilus edulis]